jgi:hypothetical protein
MSTPDSKSIHCQFGLQKTTPSTQGIQHQVVLGPFAFSVCPVFLAFFF